MDTRLTLTESIREDVERDGAVVLIDHNRPVDELDAETIRLALELGWQDYSAEDSLDRFDKGEEWIAPDVLTVAEGLGYSAEEAIEWLNSEVAPEGVVILNDGEAGALLAEPIEID